MPGLTQATVACFGIVVADRVYRVDTLPAGEGKYTATTYAETGGGPAGTAAVAIAALGGRAMFCGALGDDPAGAFLRGEMQRLGVDLSSLQSMPASRSPSCAAIVDRDGERCLVVDRGTASPSAPAGMAGMDAVLVDHRFPVEAATLLRSCPQGTVRVLDAEGGQPEDLLGLANLVDYPIFSRPGLRVATGQADPAAGLRSLALPKALACAVTLGAEGSLWLRSGQLHPIPSPAVTIRDSTGCGDVFHGAFALAVAEGQPWQQAARFASAAAALKGRNGAGWDGMADRGAVTIMLGQHTVA